MADRNLFINKFKPSPFTRAIPDPRPDVESLYRTVVALKELVETLTRQRQDVSSSAVTVDDLYNSGFADLL